MKLDKEIRPFNRKVIEALHLRWGLCKDLCQGLAEC